MEITLKFGSDKVLTNVLFKLNIFSFLNEAVNEIYKNDVLFLDLPIETFFCNLKKIIRMIEGVNQVEIFFPFLISFFFCLCVVAE